MRDFTVLFLVALTVALMGDISSGLERGNLIGWLP
jgi:hypothetical protein